MIFFARWTLLTLTDVTPLCDSLQPAFFLTLSFFFQLNISSGKHFVEFVLGQWLWRELIIGKVRPIHKWILGCQKRGLSQRRILKGPRPGRSEGQTSQEVHRSSLSVSSSHPIACLTSLIMHTSHTAQEELHRERSKEAGFSTFAK